MKARGGRSGRNTTMNDEISRRHVLGYLMATRVGHDQEAARATNLDVIGRYCVAWRTGDLGALRDCYHDEFTLHYGGHNPLSGDHVGKPAALAALAEVSRRTRRRLLSIIDFMAGPNRAVVIAREAFERGGEQAAIDRVFVYTIKDGKLHECWAYDFDQVTVDRFFR